MKVGLIDVDGHNYPNLALMKISAFHKARGDHVEWCMPIARYDRVYQSKVFDETYRQDIDWIPQADEIVKGGTGYSLDAVLPEEIEHTYPDYSIYGDLTKDKAFGYLTRGCPRQCAFCIVSKKEGCQSRQCAELSEFWKGQREVELLDPNLLACDDREKLLKQLIDSKATVNFSQGLDIRLTDRDCINLINRIKIREIHFAWDNAKQDLTHHFKRYAATATHKPHGKFGSVYVLTNFHSSINDDLYRIYTLCDLGYDHYVMIYDKPHAPRIVRDMQRWCNNKIIFGSCRKFEDYKK